MNQQKIYALIRQDKLIKFYQSPEWRKLRLKVIKRDNNECQRCKRMGKVTTYANAKRKGKVDKKRSQGKLHVHHIKELKDRPDLALIESNLETLCVRCHNDIHDRLKDYQKPRPKFWVEERW